MEAKVAEIYIYPIKSLAGIRLKESALTFQGLQYDRRWALVGADNVFISQRSFPQLMYFQPTIKANTLQITYDKTGESISFDLRNYKNEPTNIRVWDDTFLAYEVDEEVSAWFSKILGIPLKLMYQADPQVRKIDPTYAISGDETVSMADGYPVLIISEASLVDLNQKLVQSVEMIRFRPNIVISGVGAYEEEKLSEIAIGNSVLMGVKNCGRCVMVNLSLKDDGSSGEPLKTLAKYKKEGNKVIFGRNFLVAQPGVISVDDNIRI